MTQVKSMRKVDRQAVARVVAHRDEEKAREFVLNPLNEDVVRQLAFKWIITMQETTYRNGTRQIEKMAKQGGKLPDVEISDTPHPHSDEVRKIGQMTPDVLDWSAPMEPKELVIALVDSGVPRKAVNLAGDWGYRFDGIPIVAEPFFSEWSSTFEGETWKECNPEAPVKIRKVQAALDVTVSEDLDRQEKASKDLSDTINNAMNSYADSLRVEWTESLLKRTFKVNGREVAWADATQTQHRERIQELSTIAQGTLETAALHEKAISDMNRMGVESLSELKLAA